MNIYEFKKELDAIEKQLKDVFGMSEKEIAELDIKGLKNWTASDIGIYTEYENNNKIIILKVF